MQQKRYVIRCHYVKLGRLTLLSHLEIARTLERSVRRAQLPFAISQGFSPRMLIHFGSALPVGIGSTCEIFDLTLSSYVKPKAVLEALQKSCVPDLMVFQCEYVEAGSKAASVAFPISTYCAQVRGNAQALSFPKQVSVIRKKKEKIVNVADFLLEGPLVKDNKVFFSLVAKPTGSLRPDALLRAALLECSKSLRHEGVDSVQKDMKALSPEDADSLLKGGVDACGDALEILSCTRIHQRSTL